MNKVAIYPGTFDPITYGHIDVIKKALKLFDKIVVGVSDVSNKNYLFSSEERINIVNKALFKDLRLNKKNFVKIKDRPVHLKIGYAEGVNLRGTRSIKFESEITDKVGFNLKYVDNMGKGPIGSTNQDQNRNYLVSEITYKF